MKIAINTRFLLAGKIEGIGRVTYEILRRMVAHHPEDEFYFLFDRPFDKQYIFAENVKGFSIFPPTRHPVLTYSWLQFGVRPFLKKMKPDVYLSFDGFIPLGSEVPSVSTIHDLAYKHYPEQNRWADRMYYQNYMPKYANAAAHIITVSNYSKQDMSSFFQLPIHKITTIYNGVGEEFKPISTKEQIEYREKYCGGSPYFLYVGSIHPRKNVDKLIQAYDLFRTTNESDLKLVITGRKGWLTEAVERTLNQAKYQSDIVLTGYVSDLELPKLIGSAKALCYLSLFEGFGLPIVEAMACGVPVICSNRNAMAEVGASATKLVDPENIDEIVAAMTLVHQDQEYRNGLIETGLKRKLDFDWDKAAEKYYNVLKSSL